jgi:hypothetical protein
VDGEVIQGLNGQLKDSLENEDLLGKRLSAKARQRIGFIDNSLWFKRTDIGCRNWLRGPFTEVIRNMAKQINTEERKSQEAKETIHAHSEPKKMGQVTKKGASGVLACISSEEEDDSDESDQDRNVEKPKNGNGKTAADRSSSRPSITSSQPAKVHSKHKISPQTTKESSKVQHHSEAKGKDKSGAENASPNGGNGHSRPSSRTGKGSHDEESGARQGGNTRKSRRASDSHSGEKTGRPVKHKNDKPEKDSSDVGKLEHLFLQPDQPANLLSGQATFPHFADSSIKAVIPQKRASEQIAGFSFDPESVTVGILDRDRATPGITLYLKDLLPPHHNLDIRTCSGIKLARLHENANTKKSKSGGDYSVQVNGVLYCEIKGEQYEVDDDSSLEIYCRFQVEEGLKADPTFPPRITFERAAHVESTPVFQTPKQSISPTELCSSPRVSEPTSAADKAVAPSKKPKLDKSSSLPGHSRGRAMKRSSSPAEGVIYLDSFTSI